MNLSFCSEAFSTSRMVPNSAPNNQKPLVSIITPAYNVERFLTAAIESVLKQTYPNWELLLILDAKSQDSTADLAIKAAELDQRIKIIQGEDCISLSTNRNKAMDLALGEFIAFLDSDDRWLPTKLELQVEHMVNKNLNISYHSFSVIDEHGQNCGSLRPAKYEVGYTDLLKNNCIGCLTVMIRRSFVKNKRMQEVRHEDLHFWLQLLEDGETAMPISETLAEYRIRKNSLSENKLQCAVWRWRLYRHLNISLLNSIKYMCLYILFAIKKRI